MSFHPLSDIHLLVLTNDGVLRVYNIKENLNLPIKEIHLHTVAQTPTGADETDSAQMSRTVSRHGSFINQLSPGVNRSVSHAAAMQPKPMVTAFSFGSQAASRTAAAGADHNSWDLFSIYFLFSTGAISVLCPYVPPHVSLDRRIVIDLFRGEQARLRDVENAMSESNDSSLEYEVEQIQARLLWLTQTFGHVDEVTASGASNFVVTRDAGAHEFAQGWIQPAQSCGAHITASHPAHSLSLPPIHVSTSSSSSSHSYPYPASHLFAFRHSGTHPPGRFFRGFLDGRLDLLLRLVPVQPFFATPLVRALCEEVDDMASSSFAGGVVSSMVRHSALDEVCALFETGGCFERYSVASILLPADMANIEGVELPSAPPAAPAATNTLARGSSGIALARMASVSGVGASASASSRAVGTAALASPLHLFLPQYRPIVDLYDASGLFVHTAQSVMNLSYGDQIEEVGGVLARGEDDVFASVRHIFEDMHATQTRICDVSSRKLVGCVLINDPLMGKYVIQLSAAASMGSQIDVLELVRPQQRSRSVASIIQSAAESEPSSALVVSSQPSGPIDPDTVALDSTLTPFATEIAPFLARFRNFQPPAGFPAGIVGQSGSILNSPDALGEFLRIRKSYVDTIQELTLLHSLIRSRITILGKFAAEQQHMFDDVEKQIVACRANHAKINEQITMHQQMQTELEVGHARK